MKRTWVIIILGIILVAATAGGMFLFKAKYARATDDSVVPFLKEADDFFAKGNLTVAKKLYIKALENTSNPEKLKEIQTKIGGLNLNLLFSPAADECSVEYKVASGDVLVKIAAKFNTTVNFIKRSNGLKSDMLNIGQVLKINKCQFSLVVDKSQNLLFLKRGDEVMKAYIVATGRNNSTPVGAFKIVNKLENPTWFKAGAVIPSGNPDNILGTRWLGFDLAGYGIHGTTEPQTLGQQVTLGCVRMRNEEVEELYDIVPLGTEVTIID